MGQCVLDDGATPSEDKRIVYFLYECDFAYQDSCKERVERIAKFLEESSVAKGRILEIIRRDGDNLISGDAEYGE
jgi:hypothetical protein